MYQFFSCLSGEAYTMLYPTTECYYGQVEMLQVDVEYLQIFGSQSYHFS